MGKWYQNSYVYIPLKGQYDGKSYFAFFASVELFKAINCNNIAFPETEISLSIILVGM